MKHPIEMSFGVILLLIISSSTFGDEEKAVRQDNYKILQEADAFLRNKQAHKAIAQLKSLSTKTKDSKFESAIVDQYLAYAYAELPDYKTALKFADSALNSKQLNKDGEQGLRLLAGQIAFHQQNYQDSSRYLEQWQTRETRVKPDILYMMGYAAYRAGKTQTAARHLEKAIRSQKSPPKEWRQLLLSIYIDSKNYAKAETIIKNILAATADKRQWWRYLSGLYARQNKHDQALATMMLAYYSGEVEANDLLQVIKLNAQQGFPAKAARMLETEITHKRINRTYTNLKLLYQCWYMAREYDSASRALKAATAIKSVGEDYVMLSRMAMQNNDWRSVKMHCLRALKYGGLKQSEFVKLWLGIAAFKANDKTLSKQTLLPLLKRKNVKHQAAYWLKQLG